MVPTASGVVGLTALLSVKRTPWQMHRASGHQQVWEGFPWLLPSQLVATKDLAEG